MQPGNFFIPPRMLMPCHQDSGQNYIIKVASTAFENVAKFKHLVTTVTNQNYFHEGIKSELN